jgi:hypothetical protein
MLARQLLLHYIGVHHVFYVSLGLSDRVCDSSRIERWESSVFYPWWRGSMSGRHVGMDGYASATQAEYKNSSPAYTGAICR